MIFLGMFWLGWFINQLHLWFLFIMMKLLETACYIMEEYIYPIRPLSKIFGNSCPFRYCRHTTIGRTWPNQEEKKWGRNFGTYIIPSEVIRGNKNFSDISDKLFLICLLNFCLHNKSTSCINCFRYNIVKRSFYINI